jgi:hypothetical protein
MPKAGKAKLEKFKKGEIKFAQLFGLDAKQDPQDYINAVKDAVILWQKFFEAKKVFSNTAKALTLLNCWTTDPCQWKG